MSVPPLVIGHRASALEASKLMRQASIRHLLVTGADGTVVGHLSERELRSAEPSRLLLRDDAMREKALALIRVGDLMQPTGHIAHPGSTVTEVLTAMHRARLDCMPVVDEHGKGVGVVTTTDIVGLALELLR